MTVIAGTQGGRFHIEQKGDGRYQLIETKENNKGEKTEEVRVESSDSAKFLEGIAARYRINIGITKTDWPIIDKQLEFDAIIKDLGITDPAEISILSSVNERLYSQGMTDPVDRNSFIILLIALSHPDYTIQEFQKFAKEAIRGNEVSFPVKSAEDIADPKTGQPPSILVPSGVQSSAATQDPRILVEVLPPLQVIKGIRQIPIEGIKTNAILYLPNPAFVAGGFHPELYPHDTSYIISALLRLYGSSRKDYYLKAAKNQIDNFAYETKHFGFPLNGNRGYYLTRSQTNNIPSNILELFRATGDHSLLKQYLPIAVAIYEYWTNQSSGGLIQTPYGPAYTWIAHGSGPCQEVWESHEAHNFYYFRVLGRLMEYSQMADSERPHFAQGFDYSRVVAATKLSAKAQKALRSITIPDFNYQAYILPAQYTPSGKDEPIVKMGDKYYIFTPEYYTSDRASRVSGYDSNHLYGPFNAFTTEFIPVAHNVQLYRHARDIAQMYRASGDADQAENWEKKTAQHKQVIMGLLWNTDQGMLFEARTVTPNYPQRIQYPFASSAYALWAGIFDINNPAEKEQLMQLINYVTTHLEGPNGIYASGYESGLHWDKPYVWPIQQGMIVAGLREYAAQLEAGGDKASADILTKIADQIAIKYLVANYADWFNTGQIGEKKAPREEHLFTGYENKSNYTWNTVAVLDLYNGLSPHARAYFDSTKTLEERAAILLSLLNPTP